MTITATPDDEPMMTERWTVVETLAVLNGATLKDPYDFSFIAMDEKYREEELKTELIKNIEQFLQELGKGFSYLGREYKLQVGETQRAVDMLFYNVIERRYYVIEVKVRKFDPADIGQIGTYMVAVNHQLKRPDVQQTVGLIICREKDRVTVQYALESSSLPIGVFDYVLERFIPADFKSQMPTILKAWKRKLEDKRQARVFIDVKESEVVVHSCEHAEVAGARFGSLIGWPMMRMGNNRVNELLVHYQSNLKFVLDDPESRAYSVYRMCYRGEGGWMYLDSGALDILAKKTMPHLELESFYELM